MNVATLVVLDAEASAAADRARVLQLIEAIDGRIVSDDAASIVAVVPGFVRAINTLRSFVAASAQDGSTIARVAMTQAVMARASDGSAALSVRCTTTLASLAQHALPGQIVMDTLFHSMIALESPVYARAFRSVQNAVLKRPIFTCKLAGAFESLVDVATSAPNQHASGGHWMPPNGPERERLLETARRVLANEIGPLASVITSEAAARAKRVPEMIRLIADQLPNEQRATLTKHLARALGV